MRLNEKHFKYTLFTSAILSVVFIVIYYFILYVPLIGNMGSLLGYPKAFELFLVYTLIFIFSLPITYTLILLMDYNRSNIYPKEWITVTLINKKKEYYSSVHPRGGQARSGYRYWFEFEDEDGEKHNYYGSSAEYECLIEGAKIQLDAIGNIIREIAIVEEHN